MTSKLTREASAPPGRVQSDDIRSPCIGYCRLSGGVCGGCGRRIEEIEAWPRLCGEEKLEILRNLDYIGRSGENKGCG